MKKMNQNQPVDVLEEGKENMSIWWKKGIVISV